MAFTLESFIADCLSALEGDNPRAQVEALLKPNVEDPAALERELGAPARAEVQKLYVAESLTIINVVWAPRMTLLPHNHNMWAVIGVYRGREDNIFWRRLENDDSGRIKAAGAMSLGPGEVKGLGVKTIHSVTNPTGGFTRAIHVYGGDFFALPRSEWEPETLTERPYDLQKNMQLFEAENAGLELRSP